MPSASSDFHALKDRRGCLTVPMHAGAVQLVLDLEARGLTLTTDGADLIITPGSLLRPADQARLLELKPHVLRFLVYTPPGVH